MTEQEFIKALSDVLSTGNVNSDFYEIIVIIGIVIMSSLMSIIVFFVIKYFNRVDSFPADYVGRRSHDKDITEMKDDVAEIHKRIDDIYKELPNWLKLARSG